MNERLADPLLERELSNAPGGFYVITDRCLTCALPVQTAPSSMSWHRCPKKEIGALHCHVHRQPQTDDEVAAMVEAAVTSCVQAIRYCGTGERVLSLFRKAQMTWLCDALHP